MGEDRAKQLALLYKAIDDVEQERTEANADFKARLEALRTQANQLRYEIITGQNVNSIRTACATIQRRSQ